MHENQKTHAYLFLNKYYYSEFFFEGSIVNLFYVFFSLIPKNKYISSGFEN